MIDSSKEQFNNIPISMSNCVTHENSNVFALLSTTRIVNLHKCNIPYVDKWHGYNIMIFSTLIKYNRHSCFIINKKKKNSFEIHTRPFVTLRNQQSRTVDQSTVTVTVSVTHAHEGKDTQGRSSNKLELGRNKIAQPTGPQDDSSTNNIPISTNCVRNRVQVQLTRTVTVTVTVSVTH